MGVAQGTLNSDDKSFGKHRLGQSMSFEQSDASTRKDSQTAFVRP